MPFDQSMIRELHARIDIATVIGEYVPLRKRGNDLVGLCPFHAEKTPSFHVHPEKGFFKCFGCNAGGDVIAFLQRIEGVPFGDAVRTLAKRAGLQIEEESPQAATARSEREAMHDANRIAAAFFARMLASPLGESARAYCAGRGLDAAIIERFGLGYAPDSWSALRDELAKNGVDPQLAIRAGLLKAGERGPYDFYRDRLMVPTRATTGEIVAFGGRALGDAEPKYLNTTTTPVYTKGRYLFGLDVARRAMNAQRTAIVVEGYLDCIALHQAGIENAVAALGTSFTVEQAHELRKFADAVFLCFDGDAAGTSAARKAIETTSNAIEHAGLRVRVVALPPQDDPDSFVRKQGAPALRALLDSAVTALEFRLEPEIARLRDGFSSRAVVAREAEELIRKLAPREEWDRWRLYVAGRLQVNVDDLRNSRFLSNVGNFGPRVVSGGSRHIASSIEPLSFERDVLAIVLEEPALAVEFRELISPARFRNGEYAAAFARICESAPSLRESADALALFAEQPELVEMLTGLIRRDRSTRIRYETREERRAHLELIVERLAREDEQRRYRELSRRIDEQDAGGLPIESALRSEYDSLVAKLKK